MTEQDNIKELFSRSLENHSLPVRPEVWQGLQAKMAAAGVASSSVAATKGISALTKWILGGAAVTGTAVITTVALVRQSAEKSVNVSQKANSRKAELVESSQKMAAPNEGETKSEHKQFSQNSVEKPETSEMMSWIQPAVDPTPDEVLPEGNKGSHYVDPNAKEDILSENAKEEIIQREKQQPVIIDATGTKTESSEIIETNTEVASVEFFPNIFSPNGDGINDFYELKFRNVESVEISIIDSRNNKVVFESQNPEFKWYGYISETTDPAPDGLYACLIRYKDRQGKTYKKTQIIQIQR